MAWYVGVDPSSQKVGLAAIHDETGEVRSHEIHAKGREFAHRYVYLRTEIRCFLRPIEDDGVWRCVVEQPNTSRSGAVLGGSFGVAMEAAASLLSCPIDGLKTQQVDRLAAVKHVRGQRKACVGARARVLGYRGSSQDVADAVVCAEAARVLSLQEEEIA